MSATTCSSSQRVSDFVNGGDVQLTDDDTVKLTRSRHNDEFILAMKEDLSEWLNSIHFGLTITAEDFFEQLETGVVLCRHANLVIATSCSSASLPQCLSDDNDRMLSADNYSVDRDEVEMTSLTPGKRRQAAVVLPGEARSVVRPQTAPASRRTSSASSAGLMPTQLTFMSAAQRGSFHARDNISQFISWCRTALRVPDILLFETEDLVSRKHERNVILCLLEVARRGARLFGMAAPTLIRFEAEIDAELAGSECSSTTTADSGFSDCCQPLQQEPQQRRPLANESETKLMSAPQPTSEKKSSLKAQQSQQPRPRFVIAVDMMSLDEMVRIKLSECTCAVQYPMIKVTEGKYRIGDSLTHIFLRILRSHVMVRIGGGWDTLDCYLDRHDPCRCNSKQHRNTHAFRVNATSHNGSINDVNGAPGDDVRPSMLSASQMEAGVNNRASMYQQNIPTSVAIAAPMTLLARRQSTQSNAFRNVPETDDRGSSITRRQLPVVPDNVGATKTTQSSSMDAEQDGHRTNQTPIKLSTNPLAVGGEKTRSGIPVRPSSSKNPETGPRGVSDDIQFGGLTPTRTGFEMVTSPAKWQQQRSKSIGPDETKQLLSLLPSARKAIDASSAGAQNRSALKKLFSASPQLSGCESGGDNRMQIDHCWPVDAPRSNCCARSSSIDCFIAADDTDVRINFDNESVPDRSYDDDKRLMSSCDPRRRLRRSMSVQECSSPLVIHTLKAPPEDPELNVRMEMMFEEYREAERRRMLRRQTQDDGGNQSRETSGWTTMTTSSSGKKSAAPGETAATTIEEYSTRAKSVGDLFAPSSVTSTSRLVHLAEDGLEGSSASLASSTASLRSATPSSKIATHRMVSPLSKPRCTSASKVQRPISKVRASTTRQDGVITNHVRTAYQSYSGRRETQGKSSGNISKTSSVDGSKLSRSLGDVSSTSVPMTTFTKSVVRETSNGRGGRQQPQPQTAKFATPPTRMSASAGAKTSRVPPVTSQRNMVDAASETARRTTQEQRDRQRRTLPSQPPPTTAAPPVAAINCHVDQRTSESSSLAPRSRIPLPVGSSSSASSRYQSAAYRQPLVLRRFDSGVDLGSSLSPTVEYSLDDERLANVDTSVGSVINDDDEFY